MMFPSRRRTALFPKLSATKEREAKLQLANKAVLVTAALMLPVVVICRTGRGSHYLAAFGRNFIPAVSPFVWLMPGTYFLGIETVMVQLLNSEGFSAHYRRSLDRGYNYQRRPKFLAIPAMG